MRMRLPWLVVAFLAALLSACGNGVLSFGDDTDQPVLAGTWQLTEGHGPEGEVEFVDSHPITLEIDGAQWRGTAACNDYSATADLEGDALELTQLMWTEMACHPPEVMESESAYLAALRSVDTLAYDDGELTFSGPGTELVFRRTETPV